MDELSSSKVTVEYHDPSGVFGLVQEDLVKRLPLRNLHWKAPTRPLRSIDSLHVDLVPSKESARLSATSDSGSASAQGGSAAPTRTTEEILRPPIKEKQRRHQIPGLRQTPYLKVYLLRCDDSDSYKSTARKQIRDWVKEHTPPSQSSSSTSTLENHDAFEWMILHVVIPDTPAASQPRGSSGNATGEKEKSGSRWARGTTTLLEKLRADFNISSKSAPDRVAQIRMPKERVPPHMLPAPAAVTSPPASESPQDQDRAWSDVITRFKTLILSSFDLRVSQYEDDIRKNEAKRSFPGWNFNTFFILKEGLARGFESVGLVEDALLGYDELSVGLDTVIRDQASDDTQGSVILSYSEDLFKEASGMLQQSQKPDTGRSVQLHDEQPINAHKKDYRALILANNISIFDFQVYIFARQMSLLLRLGNSLSTQSDLANKLQPRPGDDPAAGTKVEDQANSAEDLYSFAELCSRALNFVTFAARLLRDDIVQGAKANYTTFPESVVDNVVRSWTWTALDQILQKTATSSLPFTQYLRDASSGSSSKSLSFGGQAKEQKLRVSEQKSMIHPSRSSSLGQGRSSTEPVYSQPTTTGQVIFENGQYHDRPAPAQTSTLPQAKNGLQELAGTRAQLIIVQRRVLEQVGKSLEWDIGWAAVIASLSQHEELSDVNLDEEDEDAEKRAETKVAQGTQIVGIFAQSLKKAVMSLGTFRQTYEALSDYIVKHYMAAGHTKSAEGVLGDLAALRFEQGDFAAASMYFGRMASTFAEARWNTVESVMLQLHAKCLRKLNRKDEYVRTLLDLLSKSAASSVSSTASSRRVDPSALAGKSNGWLNDDEVDTVGIFNELIDYSQQLPYDVSAPMAKYFGDISVEPYVRHYEDKDGFQLRLSFRHVFEDDVTIKAAKIRLVSADSNQGKDIWLEHSEPKILKKGSVRLSLDCNINTIGRYMVDKIVLEAKRIVFVHEPFQKTEATTPLGIITSVSAHSLKAAKKAQILCYPRSDAFDARVYLSHFLHIDKPRHIEIECTSGRTAITRAEVRLKSASAGLRLRTAKALVEAGDTGFTDKSTPGLLAIGAIAPNSSITLKVPYDMESLHQDLNIKVEIDYLTDAGQMQYFANFTIPVDLPLDVNVHDHFKRNALFSKFNIKTANHVPLQLLDVELQSSEKFQVHAPKRSKEPLYVFAKQPVAVTYKITNKTQNEAQKRQSKVSTNASLALSVTYKCLDEDVRDRLSVLFAADVASSPVEPLGRLLADHFKNQVEHSLLPAQFERIALLDKVDMGTYEGLKWQEVLDGLPVNLRDETRTWLQKWHESNKSIPLTHPTTPLSPPRQMIITVSIPQTHILHTAFLAPSLPSSSSIVYTGQPIPTTVRITHTRAWAPSTPAPLPFIATIDANPETWLIAGPRRMHFSAAEDEVKEWSVVLVPLQAGVTLLPGVDVRLVKKEGEEGEMGCETDYLSYGDVVSVVRDVGRSEVGIGDMGKGGGSVVWLEGKGVKEIL